MNFFEEASLRLKQVLKVTDDKQVAEALGLSPRAWSGRKKSGGFPETELYALAAKRPDLKLDVSYVLTGRAPSKLPDFPGIRMAPKEIQERASKMMRDYAARQAPEKKQQDEVRVQLDVQQYFLVPHLPIKASTGDGYVVDTEDEIGRFAFRRDWLRKKVSSPDQLRVITAKGRSMEPTVRDGDILLVDTSPIEKVRDGLYVLEVEGECRCKRLTRTIDGGLRIYSDNSIEFPAEDVPPGRVDQVRLVGRVIWVGGER